MDLSTIAPIPLITDGSDTSKASSLPDEKVKLTHHEYGHIRRRQCAHVNLHNRETAGRMKGAAADETTLKRAFSWEDSGKSQNNGYKQCAHVTLTRVTL